MPYFTYYTTHSSGTVWDDTPDDILYPQNDVLMQELWEEHQQMIDQQEKQAEELRRDKVNYPLFFLKEGIV